MKIFYLKQLLLAIAMLFAADVYSQCTSQPCTSPPSAAIIDGPTKVVTGAISIFSLPLGDNSQSTWVLKSSSGQTYGIPVSTGNAIEIPWNNIPAGTYTLTATPKNLCGSGVPVPKSIQVLSSGAIDTAPSINVLSGTDDICGTTTYSVPVAAGKTVNWIYGFFGQPEAQYNLPTVTENGNEITLTWNSCYQPNYFYLGATYTDNITGVSGLSARRRIAYYVPIISGPSAEAVCHGSTSTFSVTNLPSGYTLVWSTPDFGTINSSGNSATVTWSLNPANTGRVWVIANVYTTCGARIAKSIKYFRLGPPPAPTISGSSAICAGTGQVYAAAIPGTYPDGAYPGDVFNWSATGATPTPLTGTTTSVTWSSPGNNYQISAYTSNACGSSTTTAQPIAVGAAIANAGAITPSGTICQYGSSTFTTTPISGATEYVWTLIRPNGPQTTTTTTAPSVTFSSLAVGSHSLYVQGYNGTCYGIASNLINFTPTASPTLSISNPNPMVCLGLNGNPSVHVTTNTYPAPTQYKISWITPSPSEVPYATMGMNGNQADPMIAGYPNTLGIYDGFFVIKNQVNQCESAPFPIKVTVNQTPVVFTLSGGGSICTGGQGANLTLSGSEVGLDYQLMRNGIAIGSPVPGTGNPLPAVGQSLTGWTNQTNAGMYQVLGSGTGFCSRYSTVENIVVQPLPTAYQYGISCNGTAVKDIVLYGSQTGVNYQLKIDGINSGNPVAGTGSAITWTNQTTLGTYTIEGTNASNCTKAMTGTVVISAINLYDVGGGGANCQGGSGKTITLSGSQTGVNYQLMVDGVEVGAPVVGTNAALSWPNQAIAGNYTVSTTEQTSTIYNPATSVTGFNQYYNSIRTAAVINGQTYVKVAANQTSAGAGVYPIDGTKSVVVGTTYKLRVRGYNASTATASIYVSNGTNSIWPGVALPQGAANEGWVEATFTVPSGSSTMAVGVMFSTVTSIGDAFYINEVIVNKISSSNCNQPMSGSATVSTSPLPAIFSLGDPTCNSASGSSMILNGSETNVNYQLKLTNGATIASPIPGNGSALPFYNLTQEGFYTVVATSALGCTNTMDRTPLLATNPLPLQFALNGGGAYCSGGTGKDVTMNYSEVGVNYQLKVNGVPSGSPKPGTGGMLTWANQTVAGTYEVDATYVTDYNLIANANANSTSGFYSYSGPAPTTFSQNGETYVKEVASQSTGTPGIWPIESDRVVTTGFSYKFRVKGYRTGTGNANLYVRNVNTSANLVTSPVSLPLGSANEAWVETTVTIPAGCSKINVGVLFSSQVIGDAFYINALSLSEVSTVNCPRPMSTSVAVVVNPLPTITVDPVDLSVCPGEGITLIAKGASTYVWTLPTGGTQSGASLTVTPATATTYSVKGTDANTCFATVPATVTIRPLPVVTTVDKTICSGAPVNLALTSNLTGTSMFTWKVKSKSAAIDGAEVNDTGTGDITHVLTRLIPTTGTIVYTVTPTTNSCPGIPKDITVTVNGRLTPGTISGDQTICSGGNPAVFTQTAGSGPGTLTYKWVNSTNIADPSYLDAPNGGVQIYDVPGGVLTQTMYYHRLVTTIQNGIECSARTITPITVTVNKVINNLVGSDQVVCQGSVPDEIVETITPTWMGSMTHTWKKSTNGTSWGSAGSGKTLIPDAIYVTTYYKRIATTVYSGVTCTTESNIVTKTVDKPAIRENTPALFCAGQTINSELATDYYPNFTYKWYKDNLPAPNGGNATFTATQVGVYYVEVTNPTTGCTNSSATITVGPATGQIRQRGDLCSDGWVTLTADPGSGYVWKVNGVIDHYYDGEAVYEVYDPALVTVDYSSTGGCAVTASIEVKRIGSSCIFARIAKEKPKAAELLQESTESVYPNPASDEVTVSVPQAAETKLEVSMISQLGYQVASSTIPKGDTKATLNSRNVPGGIYIVLVKSATGTILRNKVVVMH